VAKLSETTARTTIGMMRSIASHKPISPFHLAAADDMERLLEEVLTYRKEKNTTPYCGHEETIVKGSLVHCKKCNHCFGVD